MKTLPLILLLFITYLPSFGMNPRLTKPFFIASSEGNEGYSKDSTKSEDSGLWLVTAKVTESYTSQQDTLITFMAGNKKWDKEKHCTVKTVASGEFTAVIENMAVDPVNEFQFDGDPNEPKIISVSGEGSHSESSKYLETIDGTMISANNRDINVSGSATGVGIQFYYSNDYKSIGIGININGVGSDKGRMFYDEWKDYGGNIDHYNIPCSAGCDLSTDKNCTITKTAMGYQASWKLSENKELHTVDGPEFITKESSMEVTIRPYKEPDKPEIVLYGCSDLETEEQGNVIASGKPEGGTFRFWAEPSSMLTVETDGSSANLTGASPEKGTLFVEYTTPEGKTNQTSQPASCVKVENYNGGQDIPQIALYDIDGKKLPGIKNVSLSMNPEGGSDLLKFVPADPAILSAVGLGDEVQLQGVHNGKTTLQAKTNCDQPTGPSVEVEVVNCDEETIARLEEMNKIATENQKQAYEKINEILDSEEFKEAADNIKKSTIELAEKTALTIMTSGENEGAIETAMEVVEAGATLKDLITSHTTEDLNFNELTAMMKATGAKALKAIAANLEVIKASTEFGKQLGKLIGTEEEMQNAIKWAEQANKQKEDIVKRQKFCRGEPEKQPTQTKQEPTAQTTSKTGKSDNSSQQGTTQNTERTTEQQTTTEEPKSDGTEVTPPPPTPEPQQVGLPYEPESSCGCNSSQKIGVTQQSFLTLQAGMKNLSECVNSFSSGALKSYGNTLESWKSVCDAIDSSVKAGPASFKKVSSEALPQIDSIITGAKSYDKAGKDFMGAFQDCPQSMETGIDLIRSANNIPENSGAEK